MKAVLFDLDGTLLNREATLHAFCEAQHRKFNLPGTTDNYVRRVVELDANGYVRKEIVYAAISEELGLHATIEQEMFTDYMNRFQDFCVPFEGMSDTLQQLKQAGYLLGMITNGRQDGQLASINALNINSFFDVILISETEGIAKPEAAIFERALDRLDITPDEACYVGDHPINDMEAARKVGLKTIWKRNGQDKKVHSDVVIDTLPEILTVLKGMD